MRDKPFSKELFMRTAVAATLAATIFSGSIGFAGAATLRTRALATPAAPAGWAATATQGISIQHALDLGAVANNTPIHLVVGLRGNMAGASSYVRHLYTKGDPLYHHFLTPAQFTAMFSVSPAQASAVTAYLNSFGMRNVQVTPNRVLVTAQTDAATASRAFNTSIHQFSSAGSAIYSNVSPALVPSALGGTVQSVGGLSSFKVHTDAHFAKLTPAQQSALNAMKTPTFAQLRATRNGAANVPPNCNNQQWVADVYADIALGTAFGEANTAAGTVNGLGLPVTVPAPGAAPRPTQAPVPNIPTSFCYPAQFSIAAYRFAYDDEGNATNTNTVVADYTTSCVNGPGCLSEIFSDLKQSEFANGLPQAPASVRQVDGPESTDTSGEGEWDLDLQAAVGMGGGAKAVVAYNTSSNSIAEIPVALSAFTTDNYAKLINFSVGLSEAIFYSTGLMQTTDFLLAETMAQGQTATVATGDTGSFGAVLIAVNGVPAGEPPLDYPATSPYALAVGGTSLLASSTDGTYMSEASWYSGGGGLSFVEQISPWQGNLIQPATFGQGLQAGNRMVPDIAMNADLDTGMITYIGGRRYLVGGTSLAAPMAEGVLSRIESEHNNAWGTFTPSLYAAYYNGGGGIAECQFQSATTTACPPGLPPNFTPTNLGGFNDVFLGANGYYTAAPGFDLNTGMGTLDINKLFIAFGS
jgi:subtilase family serine protease